MLNSTFDISSFTIIFIFDLKQEHATVHPCTNTMKTTVCYRIYHYTHTGVSSTYHCKIFHPHL